MEQEFGDRAGSESLKILPPTGRDSYLLCAASFIGLIAVLFYVYSLVTYNVDDYSSGDESDEDLDNGRNGTRTSKRLTKEERKAGKISRRLNFPVLQQNKVRRLNLDTLKSKLWHIPQPYDQEGSKHEEDVCRALQGSSMHVEEVADLLGITCWHALASITVASKNGKLLGVLRDDGIYKSILAPANDMHRLQDHAELETIFVSNM